MWSNPQASFCSEEVLMLLIFTLVVFSRQLQPSSGIARRQINLNCKDPFTQNILNAEGHWRWFEPKKEGQQE